MSESSAVVPQHIGIILDGNRRWAKAKNLPAFEGHRQGYETFKKTAVAAFDKGVSCVSAYIFSTENWTREKPEVNFLLDLALRMVTRDLSELNEHGIRIVWFGSAERVSDKLLKALRNAEEATKHNKGRTLVICFNYGGKLEITEAVKKLVNDGVAGDDITEEKISDYLYEPSVPPVDLLIRTSGEQRISNFMLWRAAYSELYFTEVLWPDFSTDDLDDALQHYASRQRRFGT